MRPRTILLRAALLVGALLSQGVLIAGTVPLPDSRLGVRTAPMLLLSRADVQADLGMGRAQIGEAEEALSALYQKASELRGIKGEKAIAARRAIDEEQQRWIETKLTEAQRNRIAQIELQWEGATALVSRPAVAESLGLTLDQHAALKKAVEESLRERSRGEASLDVERKLGRLALGILSEPQRDLWKSMLGRPFHPRLSESTASRRGPAAPGSDRTRP
jgi:hypothetical protein